jgi:hypothetical protein
MSVGVIVHSPLQGVDVSEIYLNRYYKYEGQT